MLAAVTCFLFTQTLIAKFAISWFGVAFVVIDSWPIRAICAEVPSVIRPFSLSISTSHFAPPSISICTPNVILVRYTNIVNQSNRIYDYDVCGRIWIALCKKLYLGWNILSSGFYEPCRFLSVLQKFRYFFWGLLRWRYISTSQIGRSQ